MLDGPHGIEAGVVGDTCDVQLFQDYIAIRLLGVSRDFLAALFGFVAIPV